MVAVVMLALGPWANLQLCEHESRHEILIEPTLAPPASIKRLGNTVRREKHHLVRQVRVDAIEEDALIFLSLLHHNASHNKIGRRVHPLVRACCSGPSYAIELVQIGVKYGTGTKQRCGKFALYSHDVVLDL